MTASDRRVRVRFAPSPTGPLHIGGVRTALYNFLFARQHGGDFLLRIEDTDQNRFVPGAEAYILEALRWAGITHDEGPDMGGPHAPYRQSERKEMYRQYAEQLIESGHAYYAFDTAEELDAMRDRMTQAGMASPKYDHVTREYMKNSLSLPADEVKARLDAGEQYVIRMKIPRNEEIRLHDIIRGWVVVQSNQLDDKVLFKSDGMPTYHLANVVDDYLMQITHVIRGEEWLPSAPLHVLLYQTLGWEDVMPQFAHLPLLLRPDGNGKLSKRDGDRLGFPVFPLSWPEMEITGYRESGYLPEAFVNILALLGWHPSSNQEMFTMDELISQFILEKVSKSGARFDPDKARWFNQQYIRKVDNEELADDFMPQLEAHNIKADREYVEQVCGLIKEKATFTKDFWSLGYYFFERPEKYPEDIVAKKWDEKAPDFFLKLKKNFAAQNDYSHSNLQKAYEETAAEMGVKPGQYMQLLRVILSGEGGGPALWEMISLIGKEEVNERLNSFLEKRTTVENL
jgi:glutamyl-tRNA synthetase